MNPAYRLLRPPVFPDEEQTRIAHLLHWILLSLFSLNFLDLALLLIFAPETLSTFWLNGVLFAACAASFWFMRQGKVRLAGATLCLSFWVLLAYYLLLSGGVTSPAFGFMNIVIIMGAVLLGVRGAVAFGLLSVVTAVILYWAGNNGVLSLSEELPTPARLFATQTTIFLTLATFMVISGRSIHNALTRSRTSERTLAERNRQLQQEIIEREWARQEQARLAAILETTSDFVGMIDAQGKLLYLNSAGRTLVAMAENAEITRTTLADYHPSQVTQRILDEALPTAVREGTWSGETLLLTRDGREIPVSQVVIAHRGADGQVELYSTIIRDLSEHKQAEQQRLELALQSERLESFKEFLGNISHDLKTPITIINTSLYLLERLEDSERRQEKIENIKGQMILLERYIQDLLTVTRLDHTSQVEVAPLDLNQLLSNLHSQFASVAHEKGLTIRLDLDASIPSILADEHELHRAVANLVENAINYTPGGGSVVLQTYAHDGKVIAQITDTGVGIAAEELRAIFNRFYRSSKARQIRPNGTGLGLAIVKRIIEIHGGGIEVESRLGQGTTFRVWLPLPSISASGD